jgi:hypothetical protein
MPKENKTSMQLAQLAQAETVRRGMPCDVMVSADPAHGWIATALVRGTSRASEFQSALDVIVSDMRKKYTLKQP